MERPDADQPPPLQPLPAPSPAPSPPDDAVALREYLANMRLLAEAQRDVMLSFRRAREVPQPTPTAQSTEGKGKADQPPTQPTARRTPPAPTDTSVARPRARTDAVAGGPPTRINGSSERPGLQRLLLETVNLAPAAPSVNLAGQAFAIISDPWEGLSELTGRLQQAGADVRLVPCQPPAPAGPEGEAPSSAAQALERLGPLDGVIHLGGLDAAAPVDARGVFATLRPTFTSRCSTFVAAVSTGQDRTPAAATGTVGLMRSLARDLTDRNVRVVEFAGNPLDPYQAAQLLADEVIDAHAGTGPVTVAYRNGTRTTLTLGKAQSVDRLRPSLPLNARSVVVVTGGARGIAARCAMAIARATGCRVELLGRTPPPSAAEDPATAAAADRPALLEVLRGQHPSWTPAEIDARADDIIAAREVRATIHALGQLGTPAGYRQVDVRHGAALARALAEIRWQHGRIDAVVHGASTVHDRLAQDKSEAGFDRVFATKVDAARTLLEQLGDDVRLVVLFGSVSAVVGHRGQADHSAASQAMGELATRFDGVGGRRVVCLHWGPWLAADVDGNGNNGSPAGHSGNGAVPAAGRIQPEEGTLALLQEMATLPGEPPEVVILRADPASPLAAPDDHLQDRLAIPPGEARPGRATPSARPGHLAMSPRGT